MPFYIVNSKKSFFVPFSNINRSPLYPTLGASPLSGGLSPSGMIYAHEVHRAGCFCTHRPHMKNSIDLGYQSNDIAAVHEAARLPGIDLADGCYYCCHDAHRG